MEGSGKLRGGEGRRTLCSAADWIDVTRPIVALHARRSRGPVVPFRVVVNIVVYIISATERRQAGGQPAALKDIRRVPW